MVKKNIKKITTLALMVAILVISQVSLSFLPNIEIVNLLIMVYTQIFGGKVFHIIYAFVILEGILYGVGIWWISYLYIWSILDIITMLLEKNKHTVLWAIIASIYSLFYGFFCGIPYIFIGGMSILVSYWISGIPFDIIHCVSNFISVFILFNPIRNAILFALKQGKYY